MKAGKLVAVFFTVVIIIAIIGTLLKNMGFGSFAAIGGIAILILYQAMFDEKKEEDEYEYEEVEVEVEVDDDDDSDGVNIKGNDNEELENEIKLKK